MILLKVLSFNNKEEWDSIINRLANKDVYYFQEYCSLYYFIGDGEPTLAIYEDSKGNSICYPFIKRLIKFPFCEENQCEKYDIITPYGYGGPLTQNVSAEILLEFRIEFNKYCQENNIISEFIRFHPLLNNHLHLENDMEIVYNRDTIYIDLTKSMEQMISKYHKNHKRNVKKAISNKLEFRVYEHEQAMQIVDSFYSLYKRTMDKLNATSYYYFSRDYYKDLLHGLSNNSMIATVFFEEKMISAALCIFEDGYLHYHLGCSDSEFLHLGANVFQFHHIALWGKEKGFHTFHLGGGYNANDSLFQFKQRFNKEGVLKFFVGKKIHDLEKYNLLVEKWEQYYSQKLSGDFFPAYRTKNLSSSSA